MGKKNHTLLHIAGIDLWSVVAHRYVDMLMGIIVCFFVNKNCIILNWMKKNLNKLKNEDKTNVEKIENIYTYFIRF